MIDNPIDDMLDADDIEEFKKFDIYSSATNIDWLLQKSIECDSHKITAYICEHYNPNYQSQRQKKLLDNIIAQSSKSDLFKV